MKRDDAHATSSHLAKGAQSQVNDCQQDPHGRERGRHHAGTSSSSSSSPIRAMVGRVRDDSQDESAKAAPSTPNWMDDTAGFDAWMAATKVTSPQVSSHSVLVCARGPKSTSGDFFGSWGV
jgi:hypothetical protein